MKTKFFLCIARPPVIETDDGDYVKLPPTPSSTVTGKTSGRRNQGFLQRRRVAPEKYRRQLSFKSHSNPFSEGNPVPVDPKTTLPVSQTNISGEKSVSFEKLTLISHSGGPESNSGSGAYLMLGSLFFTMFFGKLFGILCTLILLYSLHPRRKKGGRRSMNMVVKSPEKGSPEEYNKRVIMEGLLERKSHNRESIKFCS